MDRGRSALLCPLTPGADMHPREEPVGQATQFYLQVFSSRRGTPWESKGRQGSPLMRPRGSYGVLRAPLRGEDGPRNVGSRPDAT
jgi:hypothetical protein